MNLNKGFRALLSGRFLLAVIGAVSLPLIVRILGPENYGDYAFLMSSFSMMMLFVSPAVTEGVQKFVAEDRESKYWKEQVVGFYLRLAVGLAVVASIILVGLTSAGSFNGFFSQASDNLFYLLALYIVCSQMGTFTRHTLLGLELEEFSEMYSVLRKVASVSNFDALPTRNLLSFNGFNIVLVVLMQSLFHTDILMVKYFIGSSPTGYYKAALVLAEYIWLVPTVLQSLMLHSASKLWSEDKQKQIQSLAAKLTRYVFLLTALLGIGIFFLADRFIPLYYGAEYSAAVRPLLFLLPGAFGFALARPLYGINQATGRLQPLIVALSVSALANIALNYVLVPPYGIVGAAVATSVSYGSMLVFQVVCARYLGYSPLRGLRLGRLLVTVAVAAPAIFGLEYLIKSDILALVIVPPAGFIVYTGLSVMTGAVDTAELRDASSMLPPQVENWVRGLLLERN